MNKTVVYMGLVILIIGAVIGFPISMIFYQPHAPNANELYAIHLMLFFMGMVAIVIGIAVSLVGWRMKTKK